MSNNVYKDIFMTKIKSLPVFFCLIIFLAAITPSRAQDFSQNNDIKIPETKEETKEKRKGENKEIKNKKSFLLYLTSPVHGYSSIAGFSYNFIPLGIEIPFSKFAGLRVEWNLYYGASYTNNNNGTLVKPQNTMGIQYLSMPVILPFYFTTNPANNRYQGFYIGPFVLPSINFRFNNTFHFGAGIDTGFTWNPAGNWNFNAGIYGGYSFTGKNLILGLDLHIGYWL